MLQYLRPQGSYCIDCCSYRSLIKATLFPLLLLTSLISSAQEPNSWKIASLEWPPYASAEMDNGGTAIAELRKLLQASGIKLEVDYLPWEQAQQLAESGDYLGYFPAWPSEVNAGFVASQPITHSQLAVVALVNNDLALTNTAKMLAQYDIGIVSSYRYPQRVSQLITEYAANIKAAATESSLLSLLQTGQADIAIASPEVMSYLTQAHNLPSIRVISQFEDQPLVLALKSSANAAALLAIINNSIAAKAASPGAYIKPDKLLATHLNMHGIEQFKDFIQQVYLDLGITLEFMETPVSRAFLLLDMGLTDIDVLRIGRNANDYPNVLTIQPPLAIGELLLVCTQTVVCDRSVLENEKVTIISNRGNLMALQQFNIKSKIIYNENLTDILDILRKREIQYALQGTLLDTADKLAGEFQVVRLRAFELNHVINRKHAPLSEKLQQAIETRLKEYNPQLTNTQ
ncbi:transporter substrate-binding domain-containing protein [Rheinheimera aquimaris]|jgi:ABC-type amino acid transport substrate-binding protein|uniref:transporter substrate-binding domain-containing protein n=1 Tax=Rheinheimera aquimaris TaxID=412437 RepID=UPI000E879899|nr:transporter substrate-binding domain-containing protein [Rheinheimera aquimaris]HBN88134.1 hypothetical protein [Rheinheimera sp.]|tara:strand:- start:1892 stop:3271 length:1380 start_codon:yes stop_codon:yes gene_type:complete